MGHKVLVKFDDFELKSRFQVFFLSLTHFNPMFNFYFLMKTLENQRFPGVFRGNRNGTLG